MQARNLLLALCICAISARAAPSGPPTLFVVDGRHQRSGTREFNPLLDNSLSFGVAGAIVEGMFNKRASEIATEFTTALPTDVFDLGVQFLSAPPGFSSIQNDALVLPDTKRKTLREILTARQTDEFVLVRYMAVPAGGRFWARLVVQRVSNVGTKVESTLLATAYYVSAIPVEFQRGADGWSDSALQYLEGQVSSSFLELGDLWARIVAEPAEGRDRWTSFPAMLESQGDWTFYCRGLADCKRERLVRLSGSRAWLGVPKRAALASVDREIASKMAGFAWLEWPFMPGTAPR